MLARHKNQALDFNQTYQDLCMPIFGCIFQPDWTLFKRLVLFLNWYSTKRLIPYSMASDAYGIQQNNMNF